MVSCRTCESVVKQVRRPVAKQPALIGMDFLGKGFPTDAANLIRYGTEAKPPNLFSSAEHRATRRSVPGTASLAMAVAGDICGISSSSGRLAAYRDRCRLRVAPSCRIAGGLTDRLPVVPRQQARVMADSMTPANPEGKEPLARSDFHFQGCLTAEYCGGLPGAGQFSSNLTSRTVRSSAGLSFGKARRPMRVAGG